MNLDIFSIFNPGWWMNDNNNTLQITDSILFLFMAIPVLYLFVCALFSLGRYRNPYPASRIKHRFLVLFTVLRDGERSHRIRQPLSGEPRLSARKIRHSRSCHPTA